METLHRGFRGEPIRRFLPFVEQEKNSKEPACLPGVVVHAMGPSRDEEVIRDMNPPSDEAFLQIVDSEGQEGAESQSPFRSDWDMTIDAYIEKYKELELTTKALEYISKTNAGGELDLTVALERAVNGTSLMLMFQIGKAYLLFPGDAQWGTWNAVLNHPTWSQLLTRTNFYKIDHHGSHNATPVLFVEKLLPDGKVAMVSTHAVKIWPNIPKAELIEALQKKGTKLARTDEPGASDLQEFHTENTETGVLYLETSIPI